MIKTIVAGNGIQVSNSHVSWPAFYNNSTSSNNTLVGQVRYNGSSQTMEVYDGTVWMSIQPAHPLVELSGEVQAILTWARAKIAEEARIQELADKHPSVADALAAVKYSEEQVKIVAALVDNA